MKIMKIMKIINRNTKKITSITRTAVLLLVVSLANCLSASGEKFDPLALFESLGYCLGGGPGTKDDPFVICQYPYFRDIRLRDNWQNQYYAYRNEYRRQRNLVREYSCGRYVPGMYAGFSR